MKNPGVFTGVFSWDADRCAAVEIFFNLQIEFRIRKRRAEP